MLTVLILALPAVSFLAGYFVGDLFGWSRCWQDLTKDDSWRKAGE